TKTSSCPDCRKFAKWVNVCLRAKNIFIRSCFASWEIDNFFSRNNSNWNMEFFRNGAYSLCVIVGCNNCYWASKAKFLNKFLCFYKVGWSIVGCHFHKYWEGRG